MSKLEQALALRKGMWIWQWDRIAPKYGGVDGLVRLANKLGLDHYCVKIADGTHAPYWYGRKFGKAECQALQDAGLFVWGWHYTYGRRPEAEARVFLQQADKVGVDGLIIDAEVEYKGHADRARRYCKVLDTSLPIALSSYYVPSYHPSFPWRTFAEHSDIVMPQVYWAGHSVAWAVNRAIKENTAFGKPLQLTYPITSDLCQGTYKLRQGHELADQHNLCVNYWVLDSTGARYRQEIANWNPQAPSPSPELKVVILPDKVVDCNPKVENGVTRCDLRALAEALGASVHDHIADQNKIYIKTNG